MADSHRIRLTGNRGDIIETVAEIFGCNKTDAVIDACDYVIEMRGDGFMVPEGNLERALEHEDMTPELAAILSEGVPEEMQLQYDVIEEKALGAGDS